MTRTLLLAVTLVASCATAPTPSSDPISSTTRLAGYEMTFTLPRSTWSTRDSITGEAAITRVEAPATTVSTDGSSLLRFRFDREGWNYPTAIEGSCGRHELVPGVPVQSAIQKPGGGFDPDDSTDQVYLRWFQQDGIFLSAGEWRITAVAHFREGDDCTGQPHSLSLPVTITVVE